MFLFLALACTPDEAPVDTNTDADADTDTDTDTDTDADTDTDTDADTDADTDTDTPNERVTLDGEVTWAVDFGAASEASGLTDCSYTRHYSGAEDRSAPWMCPGCDAVFQLDVELVAGREDCYDNVSTTEPVATEYIGYGDGVWYRSSGGWLTERGPAILDANTLTIAQSVTPEESGGDFGFEIGGTLEFGAEAGDPYRGYYPPETYACGWPKADPAPYTGDYVGTIGALLPDGVFDDVCEEPVRLHDFAGTYLVIDVSAMDCGPCQSAASGEEAFVATMEDAGAPTQVITLLAPSLSDTAGTPTTAELEAWIAEFELEGPVLADRVWGLSVIGLQMPDDFGYPAFLVVNPDLEIIDVQIGFSDWSSIEATILTDAGL